MIAKVNDKIKPSSKQAEMIKCSLCGYVFEKGQKTACETCPLNYGSCDFEKCPHCGYDMPQSSRLWTAAANLINKFKKAGKNNART